MEKIKIKFGATYKNSGVHVQVPGIDRIPITSNTT